ncbi:MAG: hypothetical protein ABH950_00950, partial [Candidatus Altiarchaeota archaeon]
VRLLYLPQLRLCTIPNVTFYVNSAGDRSGPGILRFHLPRIIFTAIRVTQLRLMPYDFFKTGHRI